MNHTRLKANRALAAERQNGLCLYCDKEMWCAQVCSLEQFCARHGLRPSQGRLRPITAEHLHPRSLGGTARPENIAAACLYCNGQRHRGRIVLSPEKFRAKVQRRLKKGRWKY